MVDSNAPGMLRLRGESLRRATHDAFTTDPAQLLDDELLLLFGSPARGFEIEQTCPVGLNSADSNPVEPFALQMLALRRADPSDGIAGAFNRGHGAELDTSLELVAAVYYRGAPKQDFRIEVEGTTVEGVAFLAVWPDQSAAVAVAAAEDTAEGVAVSIPILSASAELYGFNSSPPVEPPAPLDGIQLSLRHLLAIAAVQTD